MNGWMSFNNLIYRILQNSCIFTKTTTTTTITETSATTIATTLTPTSTTPITWISAVMPRSRALWLTSSLTSYFSSTAFFIFSCGLEPVQLLKMFKTWTHNVQVFTKQGCFKAFVNVEYVLYIRVNVKHDLLFQGLEHFQVVNLLKCEITAGKCLANFM